MDPDELGFDRVVLIDEPGGRSLTVSEFQALPLAVRLRALLGKRIAFYRGPEHVDMEHALAALRRRAARPGE